MAYTLNYSYIDIDDAYTVAGYTGTPVDVVIPNIYEGKPVISISDTAFFYCDSLTSITIPDSVTSIGSNTVMGCSSLTSINVSENNKNYKSIDGNLYSKDGKTLIQYAIGKTATEFTIPDSVTSIGSDAFASCNTLTSIIIPNSVTSIGKDAFSMCISLRSVIIPNSVTSIGNGAFENCSGLTSATIGNSVTSIGWRAFYSCSALTSITIPASVTSIESYAFNSCINLTSINLLPTLVPSLGGFVFYGINQNAKFYCFQSAIDNYKSATDWNTYADKFVVDDIRLYFIMNSISAKNYFTTKISDKADKVIGATGGNFAGLDNNGNLTDSGKKASDFSSPLNQSTDLSSTSKTLTLTADTRYALGTLTALDITFPASGNDGDTIIIEFVSGSIATTLTRDTTNAIYNFDDVSANKFIEFNAEFKVSIGKWVVYSTETNYQAV